MVYVAIALAIVAVLAAGVVIWLAFSRVSQQKRADDAERNLQGWQEKLDTASKAFLDEVGRRDRLIDYLKQELGELENALSSSRDVSVVRARLRRVLSLPPVAERTDPKA